MQNDCVDLERTFMNDNKHRAASSVARMGPKKGLVWYYCGIRGHVKPECCRGKADRDKCIFRDPLLGVKVGACNQPGLNVLETEKEEEGVEEHGTSSICSINNAEEPSDPALIYGRLKSGQKMVVWADTGAQNTAVSQKFVETHNLKVYSTPSRRRNRLADGRETVLRQKAMGSLRPDSSYRTYEEIRFEALILDQG